MPVTAVVIGMAGWLGRRGLGGHRGRLRRGRWHMPSNRQPAQLPSRHPLRRPLLPDQVRGAELTRGGHGLELLPRVRPTLLALALDVARGIDLGRRRLLRLLALAAVAFHGFVDSGSNPAAQTLFECFFESASGRRLLPALAPVTFKGIVDAGGNRAAHAAFERVLESAPGPRLLSPN